MAHDLDFRTKKKITHRAERSIEQDFFPHRKRNSSKANYKIIPSLVGVFILIIISVAAYAASISPAKTKTNSAALPKTTDQASLPTAANQALTIDLYDGGAGANAATAVVSKLASGGYVVNNLGAAQFQYDKTYIWYQKGYADDANKLAALLKDRLVQVGESQTIGVFNILIYLGQK